MSTQTEAEIFDRGYRRYDGERSGVGTAMRSVWLNSIQRALGLRRKFRFKIVPIVTILLAYIPALAFLGIAVILPSELVGETVDYAGYYGLISISTLLLTAFVGPELLSTDRRTGMFGLYMASPLTRTHYLTAKASALATVLFLVTLMPLLFLLLGYTFVGLGPEGFTNTMILLGRIIAGGLILSSFMTLLGMAAATLTNRQAFASAGIVMTLIASSVLANVMFEVAEVGDAVLLADLGNLPNDAIQRLFKTSEIIDVPSWQSIGALGGVLTLLAAIVIWGYQRMEVTK